MENRSAVYFVSDVHLGLKVGDPAERERRFIDFLDSINKPSTAALYLLGDIWDFWYEYRDVVPREGIRAVAALIRLIDSGVDVWYMPGNHDIWCYSFFESIGCRKIEQPYFFEREGKVFCVGHGDGLGGTKRSLKLMSAVFHNRVCQWLFSLLHPWIAYRIAGASSAGSRRRHRQYEWSGQDERLVRWSAKILEGRKVDYFIYGHYHVPAAEILDGGAELVVLGDWMHGVRPYAIFCDGALKVSR